MLHKVFNSLNFLIIKRGGIEMWFKKKDKELKLDLPPPPPPEEDLPPVPDVIETPPIPPLEKEAKLPLPPKNPKLKTHKTKELPPMADLKDLEKELPPIPDLEELEKELPPLRKLGEKELPALNLPKIEHEKEPKIAAAPLEKPKEIEVGTKKTPTFIKVSSYKEILDNVNLMKSKLKESEDCLAKLDEIKNSKDKYLEQFRVKLEDLQKKSLYVDKNLFERGVLNG